MHQMQVQVQVLHHRLGLAPLRHVGLQWLSPALVPMKNSLGASQLRLL